MTSLVGLFRAVARPSFLKTFPRSEAKITVAMRGIMTQQNLPHLPVPPLKKTLDKYLRTVKPLITDEEFKITSNVVAKFGAPGGVGEKLQSLLEKRAKSTTNWFADWWLNGAYLEFRSPVTVYSSPGLVFPLQNFKSSDERLTYAAKMIAGALDYKKKLDEDAIPVEKLGKDPLDMSQYYKVFGTCRMPGLTKDTLHFADPNNPPRHIIVSHKNHFYKLIVYDDNNNILSWGKLLQQLNEIIQSAGEPGPPIGVLTAENRNVWGKAFKKLSEDRENMESLDIIKNSLFLLCLDGPNPDLGNLNFQTRAALQTVHGNGSEANSGNRWFDKTVQFIVGDKGEVGLTYEHSPAEGPPIAFLMDHIVNYIEKAPSDVAGGKSPKPEKLKFNISGKVQKVLETAKENVDKLVDDLEMSCFTLKAYGKEFIKSQRMSPDSYIQMAIQFAFYRIHNEPGAHYETASTRKYLDGRTEVIRSCSLESVAFAKTMLGSKSNEEKVKALQEAVTGHKQYTIEAVNGFGVDRHLLGLKLIAIENGMDIPTLFMDTAYIRSSHMRISTSQVSGKCDSFMCYGPLVVDGYGCCYNPLPNEINFGTSAYKSCPDTNAEKFRQALEKSFIEMHDALVSVQKSKL
ncbi:carnitine O-acetyltransferase-like isoform X2 [Ischnura elegans]|uniref:carnitine O-acetyltransferase-like isoform X2 n=1 Tax=Ischnura elegans TaxID=197161 RepID=UPI001ED871F3|nr:carnitine O-acetyltransferase-like isoform X2 [Ischnura elegans]